MAVSGFRVVKNWFLVAPFDTIIAFLLTKMWPWGLVGRVSTFSALFPTSAKIWHTTPNTSSIRNNIQMMVQSMNLIFRDF
jgi:hypothetical protein